MNKNIVQIYEDEIRSLEEEIKTLTEEYECIQHGSMAYSDGELMKAMYVVEKLFCFYLIKKSHERPSQEEFKQCESSPDLKTQLDLLESNLSFIMNLTGVWFTNYSRKPVEKGGTKTIHKYRLSGSCQSVPFQLEFHLMEENQVKPNNGKASLLSIGIDYIVPSDYPGRSNLKNNSNVSAVVTDLNIIIESEEHSDLSKLVSRVEETGDLLLFFKSLSCFSEWYEHRKSAWTHFKVVL
ncbi:hypothetical protein lerEdw1_015755 [Lerista edwardsae]|nr:hypothetical protein lerEdw1_015755 [Lerista edwardsae]